MIQTEELANKIEQELNGVIHTVAFGMRFKIHAIEGTYKKAQQRANGTKQAFINGILRSTGGDYTPITDINNLQTTMMLEFAVPKNKVDEFELITTSWIEDVLGEVYSIGSFTYIITPTPATPGQVDNRTPLGGVVPYSMVLGIQIIKNGMISNALTWSISTPRDGAEPGDLDYLIQGTVGVINGVIDSQRTPDTKTMVGAGYCTTDVQYENTTIVLTFPYAFTEIVKQIVKDIYNENWDRKYTLTLGDSFASGISRVCVMTKGSVIMESGKIASITCSFARSE